MPEKTHWKKVVSDPNYLGEADFNEGEEKIATIARVARDEVIQTAEGKSKKAVVHFQEQLKPMILNVARSKSIEKVAGSPYFEDWTGVKIQLYIEHGIKAFGDVVSAVRVRPQRPVIKAPVLCADCGNEIQGAMGRGADYIAAYTKKKFKVCLCFDCAEKRANKPQETAQPESEGVTENAQAEIDG